jgi:HAD superfamily hydrolase (TIGR01549 family)
MAVQGITLSSEVQDSRFVDIPEREWYIEGIAMNSYDARQSRGRRHKVAGVIFDVDGTLSRTNELIVASFNFVARKYCGRSYSEREIIAMFGPPEEGALAGIVGAHQVDAAMDDLCAFYREHHGGMAGLHEGMVELLRGLREGGARLAVFTGKGRRTTMITLQALNIESYFDLIVSGSDVRHHKPHPEGIRLFLDRYALAPEEVVMIGDSAGDMNAAREAGVTPVAALWDTYDRARVLGASPALTFERVADLTTWFRTAVQIPAALPD